MEKKNILISFMGFSDPYGKTKTVDVKEDGPILKIINHIPIKKLYLLLAEKFEIEKEEFVEENFSKKDVSIIKGIFDSKEKLFSILKERHIELEILKLGVKNPSVFINPIKLKKILDDIYQKEKDSKIHFNVTSGSTQLVSSLCLDIILNNRKGKAYQTVYSSERHENQSLCEKTDLASFRIAKAKEELTSYINSKSYSMAYDFIKNDLDYTSRIFNKDHELVDLIKYAYKFDGLIDNENKKDIKYFSSKYNMQRFKYELDDKYADERYIVNYYLSWENVYERQDFKNLLLKLTPLFFNLLKHILLKHVEKFGIDYKNSKQNSQWYKFYCGDRKINLADFEKEILSNKIPIVNSQNTKIFGSSHFITSEHLIIILKIYGVLDENESKIIKSIRIIERNVRNELAHDIKTTKLSHEIENSYKNAYDKVKSLLKLTMKRVDLYDKINIKFFSILDEKIKNKIKSIEIGDV